MASRRITAGRQRIFIDIFTPGCQGSRDSYGETVHIYHVNVTTNRHYRSHHADADASEMARLDAWLKAPMAPLAVDEDSLCICQQRSGKMLAVLIQRQQDDGAHDVRQMVICTHSRRKAVAWAVVANTGAPPDVPFAASRITGDGGNEPRLDRFERDLAWAFVTREKHG